MPLRPIIEVDAHADPLELPGELAEALRLRSNCLVMMEPEDTGGFISRFDLLRLAKRTLKGRSVHVARCVKSAGGWAISRPSWFEPGKYRIVNYDPRFLLVGSSALDDVADRAAFWASIRDYHEHRSHAKQDTDAKTFSRWFANDVIAPLRPKRVLELGCGAGRNLAHIVSAIPDAEVVGVEINPEAAERAQVAVGGNGKIINCSLYEVPDDIGSFDVVYTAGVLMHVPHDAVRAVVQDMAKRSAVAVVHFELHGQDHQFDFHRYPRDYAALHSELGHTGVSYRVFDRKDPLNAGESVGLMALLIYRSDRT
ncbi:MAG: class I SAM-dependent methyltransferase [Actinobacteria bacterium]|nr:class I SAM-dependent methyltransferase [Actinomycetota bacterium]